jgi:hypothetical protein
MSGAKPWKPVDLVRGQKTAEYDNRRSVYLSVNLGTTTFWALIKPEHVESIREALADLDASDPDKAEATTEAAE